MSKFFAKFIKNKSIHLLVITFLTTLAYINIFQNQFVIDDKVFILKWQQIRSFVNIGNLIAGAVPPGHEGVYRPLRSLLYAIYYQLFDANVFFYHLHSLTVHILSTILVYLIVEKLTAKKLLAFITSLLFGLHPIHTETITYVAASMDATGIVFFLTSFYLYAMAGKISSKLKGKTEKSQFEVRNFKIFNFGPQFLSLNFKFLILISFLFALLAFFTYEMTLTLPFLLILHDFVFTKDPKKDLLKQSGHYLPYLLGSAIYLLIRFFLLNIGARGPYLANSGYLTFLTMPKVFLKYLSLTLWPLHQANNHIISPGIEAFVYRGYRTTAIRAQSLADLPILASFFLIFILLLFAFRVRKKLPIISFGILWFFISLLPVSEIIPQGSMLNEKFLYLPSFGLILIIAYLLQALFNKSLFTPQRFSGNHQRSMALLTITVITVSFFFLTHRRNQDWRNEITLWSKDVALYPDDNAYAYFALGNAYREKGMLKKAAANYQKAFTINPHFAVAKASLAKIYQDSGQTEQAVINYKEAIEIDPLLWEARFNLANSYVRQKKLELAINQYRQVLNINPNFTPARDALQRLTN